MKKTLLTIAATTALWAVVGYAAVAANLLFVLTRSDMLELIQFIALRLMTGQGGPTT